MEPPPVLDTGYFVRRGQYNPNAPFGAYKRSSNGRKCSKWGLAEYLETKSLQLSRACASHERRVWSRRIGLLAMQGRRRRLRIGTLFVTLLPAASGPSLAAAPPRTEVGSRCSACCDHDPLDLRRALHEYFCR